MKHRPYGSVELSSRSFTSLFGVVVPTAVSSRIICTTDREVYYCCTISTTSTYYHIIQLLLLLLCHCFPHNTLIFF